MTEARNVRDILPRIRRMRRLRRGVQKTGGKRRQARRVHDSVVQQCVSGVHRNVAEMVVEVVLAMGHSKRAMGRMANKRWKGRRWRAVHVRMQQCEATPCVVARALECVKASWRASVRLSNMRGQMTVE
jgi:hypothetical protein